MEVDNIGLAEQCETRQAVDCHFVNHRRRAGEECGMSIVKSPIDIDRALE
jgi:hypothetical protein